MQEVDNPARITVIPKGFEDDQKVWATVKGQGGAPLYSHKCNGFKTGVDSQCREVLTGEKVRTTPSIPISIPEIEKAPCSAAPSGDKR